MGVVRRDYSPGTVAYSRGDGACDLLAAMTTNEPARGTTDRDLTPAPHDTTRPGPPVLLVASGPGGAGKTPVALSIACVTQALGLDVLLVEPSESHGMGAASVVERVAATLPDDSPYVPGLATLRAGIDARTFFELHPAQLIIVDAPARLLQPERGMLLSLRPLVVTPVRSHPGDIMSALRMPDELGVDRDMIRLARVGVGKSAAPWTPLDDGSIDQLEQHIRTVKYLEELSGLPGGYVGPEADLANADAIALGLEVVRLLGFDLPAPGRLGELGWDLARLDSSIAADPIKRPAVSSYLASARPTSSILPTRTGQDQTRRSVTFRLDDRLAQRAMVAAKGTNRTISDWHACFVEVVLDHLDQHPQLVPSELRARRSRPSSQWTVAHSTRLDTDLLARLDAAVEQHGVTSRTRFLRWAVHAFSDELRVEPLTNDY